MKQQAMKSIAAKLTAIAVIATWLLTGCSPAANPDAANAASKVTLQTFYNQKVTWKDCGEKLVCGRISVPVNYAKPSQGTIKLAAVIYQGAGANKQGTLLMNPGGPGGSGYDFVKDNPTSVGTANLRSHYDILGFDPRGVGRSAGVKCLSAKETDKFIYSESGYAIGSAKDLAHSKTMINKFIAACLKNTGSKMRYFDTVSTARDMDVMRAVMGDAKLNYLGFSYGTFLGNTYATLFPAKVGRMVLDGAIDPTVPDNEQSVNQIAGFDKALRAYMTDCYKLGQACPFSQPVDTGLAELKQWLRDLEGYPYDTKLNGRKLTIWGATTGIIMALYSEDYWTYLTRAFQDIVTDEDGTVMLQLADAYNERNADGTYGSNQMEANIAISCMDGRSDASLSAMQAQNARMIAASPTLGRYWQYGAVLCSKWPWPAIKAPKSYAATGSAPILVVGTTGDPATPYAQSVSLANDVLDNGHLVTYNGEGHTAYGRSNACVSDAVDAYLIDGVVPTVDPDC